MNNSSSISKFAFVEAIFIRTHGSAALERSDSVSGSKESQE